MSCLSQPRDLVVDLATGTFPTAAACFMVPGHLVAARCKAGPECFPVQIEAVVRKFAKAAFYAGTDADLIAEAAEATVNLASLVLEVAIADLLWSLPDAHPL